MVSLGSCWLIRRVKSLDARVTVSHIICFALRLNGHESAYVQLWSLLIPYFVRAFSTVPFSHYVSTAIAFGTNLPNISMLVSDTSSEVSKRLQRFVEALQTLAEFDTVLYSKRILQASKATVCLQYFPHFQPANANQDGTTFDGIDCKDHVNVGPFCAKLAVIHKC